MLFPLPDFFEKFLATEIMARNFLRIELSLNDDLCGNTCVISTGDPCSVMTTHTVVASQTIHDGLIECMTHVQRAGHVWGR